MEKIKAIARVVVSLVIDEKRPRVFYDERMIQLYERQVEALEALKRQEQKSNERRR